MSAVSQPCQVGGSLQDFLNLLHTRLIRSDLAGQENAMLCYMCFRLVCRRKALPQEIKLYNKSKRLVGEGRDKRGSSRVIDVMPIGNLELYAYPT